MHLHVFDFEMVRGYKDNITMTLIMSIRTDHKYITSMAMNRIKSG